MGLGHQVAVDLRGAAIDRRDRRVPEVLFDPTAEVGIRILAVRRPSVPIRSRNQRQCFL